MLSVSFVPCLIVDSVVFPQERISSFAVFGYPFLVRLIILAPFLSDYFLVFILVYTSSGMDLILVFLPICTLLGRHIIGISLHPLSVLIPDDIIICALVFEHARLAVRSALDAIS